MPLELDSLKSALAALGRVLAKGDDVAFMQRQDDVTQEAVRSGAIQHFEFTYELCWKFIRRWLETNISPAVADGVTRRELFRQAAESRLIQDVDAWMRHHEARNQTSHTYDIKIAGEVYEAAHTFLQDALSLLRALEARND